MFDSKFNYISPMSLSIESQKEIDVFTQTVCLYCIVLQRLLEFLYNDQIKLSTLLIKPNIQKQQFCLTPLMQEDDTFSANILTHIIIITELFR